MSLKRKVSPMKSLLVRSRRWWRALMAGAMLKKRERAVVRTRYCNHYAQNCTLHTAH